MEAIKDLLRITINRGWSDYHSVTDAEILFEFLDTRGSRSNLAVYQAR